MKPLAALAALGLASAGTAVAPAADPVAAARAEAVAAEREAERLGRATQAAEGEAARLAAERQAAAAAIAAAEARLTLADTELRAAEAGVAASEARLARQQAPVARLLSALVSMERRPPLLAAADSRSLDDMVHVRLLLDTTLPRIRAQGAGLARALDFDRRLRIAAAAARDRVAEDRRGLEQRRARFAALEARALERAARLGSGALAADDRLIAASDTVGRLGSERADAARAARDAGLLAALGPAPPRPVPGAGAASGPPFAYALPIPAAVTNGQGAVDATGVRSRGTTLAAAPGAAVAMPADGRIAFAGAYRRHDGVVIIDHGGGWMTLLLGVRTDRNVGSRLRLGQPLGRALGPVTVELSMNGRAVSAALAAHAARSLSIKAKPG